MTDVGYLREQIDRFDPHVRLEEARTPPSSWYVDPGFYRLEQRSVFTSHWCAAARVDQLPEPGSFATAALAGEPIVVLRDRDGEIRAFHNVCSHHASEVAKGSGRCTELVCPYHAWTYDLDGSLKRAPEAGAIAGLDRQRMGLQPIATRVVGPLVFTCQATDPPDLDRDLGTLFTTLDARGWSSVPFLERREWVIECNWKVYVDNYLDGGYHVAHLHKGLAAELAMKSYRTEVFDRYSIQYADASGAGKRFQDEALYAWLYPNFMINRYGPWLDFNWVLPEGPTRTRVVFDYFIEDPALADDDALARSAGIQDEDIEICEAVQRGLSSRAYDQGYYSARREAGAFAFHQLLHTNYATALE